MSHPLASRLDQIAPFHVMEILKMAKALEQQGRNLIHMGIGEPDFTAPPAVVDAAASAMRDGRLQYTTALGIPELRTAIAKHYRDAFNVEVPEHRIIVTAGASAALLLACGALVQPGAEVLMPDPSYPCNRHFVAAFEGKAKLVNSGAEQRYQLSAAAVREHWTAQTAGVLLATPSNPTGTTIQQDELKAILQEVRARGGFAIVDEIYQGLTYDHSPSTVLTIDQDAIVINSFSKYFSMTGWRLGWMVVPEHMVAAVEKLAQNWFICPSSIAQYAAVACFEPQQIAIFEARKAEMQARRDYLVPALRELGFSIPVTPDGAFYVYANCSAFTDDADRFAKDILQQAGVVITPGQDFGSFTAKDHVRFSYANSLENLKEAVRRLAEYLKQAN